ncbi:hypothetical protein D8674_038352 [Pyrus ussuriensis x Pyrus communis]|uniref:Uncharacterized protein n=1 Tax=Pyrus ussuriensis x Pyrus communis TaxID=2448454 RepID=A0A5N5H7B9_9ROSA|nr:hypothetical protein D8674_038352 [Pyrus ussuriensis x Pyrus communis]
MICGVLASASAPTQALSSPFSKPRSSSFFSASFYGRKGSQRSIFHCSSSAGPGGPGFGIGDSRSVLDAFFLGKALGEAINERIESGVGEFLSTIGRLQAEQQKQVDEFQEDVLERAKKAKERAAR